MTFPHALGFTGDAERHCGDLFARAVIGTWLLDAAQALGGDAELEALAAAQADHLAAHRLADCEGGWSYFPSLPELAPDLDSLGIALELFARAAPQHLPLCAGPVELALSLRDADGAIPTFLIGEGDPPKRRAAMQRGLDRYWGQSRDADALARFHLGLRAAGRTDIAPPLDWLARKQRPDGCWRLPWYAGAYTGTRLCLRLFDASEPDHPAAQAARTFLRQPPEEPTPMALAQCDGGAPARAALVALQQPDGSWEPSPWIRMPIGTPGGPVSRLLLWKSRAVTTALCFRALCGAGSAAAA
jgi:squalene-hopene/tetraprenyl-beta-curcumene cyclase